MRDLEVFIPVVNEDRDSPPPLRPIPEDPDQDLDRIRDAEVGNPDSFAMDSGPAQRRRPPLDDNDASIGVGRPVTHSCPDGDYLGLLVCTFATGAVKLRGPVSFTIEADPGDAGTQGVSGQVNLTLVGGTVEVEGKLEGTYDCQRGRLELDSKPLGAQVAGFLSATQPATIAADYDEEDDSFRGAVRLPGELSDCVGSWTTDPSDQD